MQYQISFKNVEGSEFAKSYTDEKLREKLSQLLPNLVSANVVITKAGDKRIAQCHLTGGDGIDVTARHSDRRLRDSINGMVAKLQRRMRRRKDRRTDQKGEASLRYLEPPDEELDDLNGALFN